jgi:hypothetical protein
MSDDLRNAYADGQQARHNRVLLEDCPHVGGLESAWKDGWRGADADIETSRLISEGVSVVVSEICDFLTRKAERSAEMNDPKGALLFETLVEYINSEWGTHQ